MKFHGIDMRGKFFVQRVPIKPEFTSADKGRLIYVIDEDEFYYGGDVEWKQSGGGAVGGTGNRVFFENDIQVTADYTITSGKNAVTAGPITIADGVTVEVPAGSTWTVV